VTGERFVDALRCVAEAMKEHAPALGAETGFDGDPLDPIVEALTRLLSAPPFAFDPAIAHRLAFSLVADVSLAEFDAKL
jgi:hypothetical protein